MTFDRLHTHLELSVLAAVLERRAEVFAPLLRRAAAHLRERQPRPGRIIDAGSGPGAVSVLLAEEFPGSEVVAVDVEEEFLARARERAVRSGLDAHIRVHRAQLPEGLGELGPADLLWAGHSLHHIGDQRAALAAFARALAPGGTLALLEGGLPTRCLPRDLGFVRPGLEARLDAAEQDWFAELRAGLTGSVRETEDWPGLLRAAGLAGVGSATFLLDLPAPLSAEARAHVVGLFYRRRESLAQRLGPEDVAALDRLLDPDDSRGLLHRQDLFLLAAQTLHVGSRP